MGTLRFTYGFAAIAGTLLYRYQLHKTSYRRVISCNNLSNSLTQLLWMSILFSLPIYLCENKFLRRVVAHSWTTAPLLLISGLNLKMGISGKSSIPKWLRWSQDKVFVLSGGFLNEAVAEVKFFTHKHTLWPFQIQLLPLLVLTACICPPGLEGSAYSTMLAVRNLGSAVSKGSSAAAMSGNLEYVNTAYSFPNFSFGNNSSSLW